MFKKILIPLDGSTFAEQVLAHLPPFIAPGQTELLLLQVIAPTPLHTKEYRHQQVAAGTEYLEKVADGLRASGAMVYHQVLTGDVTAAICSAALSHEVDLIAMTTHGRSGMSRWALGSVADHVVRVATTPVLLVRGGLASPAAPRLASILVPLDGTVLAEEALTPAIALARESRATLNLLRAIDLQTERELDGIFEQMEGHAALRDLRLHNASLYLNLMAEKARRLGIDTECHTTDQSPASAIIEQAAQQETSLIMMSTHARHGVGRWLFGSIADTVLHQATCPLLLVREANGDWALTNGTTLKATEGQRQLTA